MTRPSTLSEPLVTIEEFERLPDEPGRAELVRGRVVREPPAGYEHGRVAMQIGARLWAHVRANDLGEVLATDTGFVLAQDPPTVRAPDAAFVSKARVPVPCPGFGRLAPDLAVEVISPSDTAERTQGRILDYLEAGTRVVWLVDPNHRSVTVYRSRSDIRLLGSEDELEGGEMLPGFRLPLSDLFGEP